MAYARSYEIFKDNQAAIVKPQGRQEIMLWNLGEGLAELTETIRGDIQQIQAKLDRISQALQLR